MNITCSKCGTDNTEDSLFCQECGHKLSGTTSSPRHSHSDSSLHEAIEKIDDVMFKPNKRSSTFRNIVIILVILIVGFFIVLFISSDENGTTSNQTQDSSTVFPIENLSIPEDELNAEWVGQIFHIKGVLKNQHTQAAGNVSVRVDFYNDKEMKHLFDTRYITLIGVSANGAYSFNEPVYINVPSSQNFWYTAQIQSAEYLK